MRAWVKSPECLKYIVQYTKTSYKIYDSYLSLMG